MYNRIFCMFICMFCCIACARKPYVRHKASIKKLGDCSAATSLFSLNSNFGGERYEFDKCLPADFDKSAMTVERKGDTVLVNFRKNGNKPTNLFSITLDIDSYPRYNYVTIDTETFVIGYSDK